MTSIISGKLQGMKLLVPKKGTRPTSQKVKEAIFSTLNHYGAFELPDDPNNKLLALDLYAGSAALGFEVLSRGYDGCTFVDLSANAVKCIRDLFRSCEKDIDLSHSRYVQSKVSSFLKGEKARFAGTNLSQKYALIFIDPPYDIDNSVISENLFDCMDMINEESIIVLERSSRTSTADLPEGLEIFNTKKYGETTVYYIQLVVDK